MVEVIFEVAGLSVAIALAVVEALVAVEVVEIFELNKMSGCEEKMKISTKKMSYEEVLKLPRLKHNPPRKPSKFLATVVRIVVGSTLKQIKFSYTSERMDLVKDQPCIFL